MLLVTLGCGHRCTLQRARWAQRLPAYTKVQRTEPAVLRALVQGSAERLVPLVGCLPERQSLPGWQLRVLTAIIFRPAKSGLRRCAALPGHTLVVYDPDSALVCDIVACENAHEAVIHNGRFGTKICWSTCTRSGA